MRLKECNSVVNNVSVSGCNHYSINGVLYTESQPELTYIYSSSVNCDSIVKINLIINHVDTTLTVTDSSLISNENNASYVWYQCTFQYEEILGENNQVFYPTEPGHYTVLVTNSECSDTSICLYYDFVGLEELNLNEINVSPNPSKGKFSISIDDDSEAYFRIINSLGQEVYPITKIESNIQQVQLMETSGLYFIEFINENNSEVIKIIIE